MTSIYTRFATLPDKLAAKGFGVGGPSFTGRRTTQGDPSADATDEALSARRLVFIAASLEQYGRTFPEAITWNAPYLLFARLSVDVQKDDVYTDGTRAYLITGEPVTHYGFLLAPAKVAAQPVAIPVVVVTPAAGIRIDTSGNRRTTIDGNIRVSI